MALCLLMAPLTCWPHGTELLRGTLKTSADGTVQLECDISAGKLGYYAGKEIDLVTWGDLKAEVKNIEQRFSKSIRLQIGKQTYAPVQSSVKALHGKYPPPLTLDLPDLVPLTLTWRNLPVGEPKVICEFELTGHIHLVLRRVVTPPAPPVADNEKTLTMFAPDESLVYKTVGKTTLRLHIFNPEGHKPSDKRPAIVFFFGGGWNGGSPSQFYPHCRYLASRGMVAMSAEYRVKSRNKTTPRECVQDGKSAVRWIRQHAEQLGIDRHRIAAGGGSAGGHVAAATGTTKGFDEAGEDLNISSRPNALVLFNPVYDNGPDGYGHSRVKAYWKTFSPMHNIRHDTPPTIVFLGTKDHLIPVSTAKEYKRLMEEKGRRCDLHLYKNQPHGFFNYTKKEYYTKTAIEMDRFLASLRFLQGESTLRK